MSGSERNRYVEIHHDDVSHLTKRKWELGKEHYGDSWLDCDPEYMIRRMEEEFYEFRQAVEHDRDEGGALEELADIVNFGLMFLVLSQHSATGSERREGRDD